MHVTIPKLTADDRKRGLGSLAWWWIEKFTVLGDGGSPDLQVEQTPEYAQFIMNCYALDRYGRRRFNHVFLSRPKGCDKSGKGADLGLFEALGPCRFDHWAEDGEYYEFLGLRYYYLPGEPVGRPVQNPHIACLATSEDQPLALDTPVATTKGWKTVGTLDIGDEVFGSDGRPTPIRRMTSVFFDMDCYRVDFSDGESIVASGSHKWTLDRRNLHDGRKEPVTVTTEQMSHDYWDANRGHRYSMPLTPAFEMPGRDLLVDPYFLGLWLGDGSKDDASIAYDVQDEQEDVKIITPLLEPGEHMRIYAHAGGCGTFRIMREHGRKNLNAMRSRLKQIGVLYDKHIPADYLWASVDQRLALLQGLMDSDGCISKTKNRGMFTNTNRRLIDGIEELLTGLSYKWCELSYPKMNAWRVTFQPRPDMMPVRLKRKAANVVPLKSEMSRRRYVRSVTRVKSVPVKCIGIDNEDHLFAAGRKMVLTHNTGNVYARMLYNCQYGPLADLKSQGLDPANTRINLPFGGDIKPYAVNAKAADGGLETFSVADETHLYVKPQLKHLYETVQRNLVKRSIDSDPWMLETTTMFRPGEGSVAEETYTTAWDWSEGKIKHGRMRLYFDHRFSNLPQSEFSDESKVMHALYEAYGSAAKSTDGKDHVFLPDGRMVPVDDAGFSEEGYSLLDEGVEPGPSKNGWQSMEDAYDLLMKPTSDVGDSIRYYLNNLASTSDAWLDEAWIESHTVGWEKTQGLHGVALQTAWRQVVSPDDEITLGFDGSVSDDSTALVGCRVSDGLLFLIKLEGAPDGPEKAKWRVDRESFDGKVRWMMEHYNVVGMFADPAYFEGYVSGWENDYDGQLKVAPRKSGHKIPFYCSAWKQDVFRLLQQMRANFQYEYEPVGEYDPPAPNDVALFADPRLVNHFRNARMRDRSFGYLVFKETPNSPKKIDAMMAGLLAYGARQRFLELADEDDTDYFIPERLY